MKGPLVCSSLWRTSRVIRLPFALSVLAISIDTPAGVMSWIHLQSCRVVLSWFLTQPGCLLCGPPVEVVGMGGPLSLVVGMLSVLWTPPSSLLGPIGPVMQLCVFSPT